MIVSVAFSSEPTVRSSLVVLVISVCWGAVAVFSSACATTTSWLGAVPSASLSVLLIVVTCSSTEGFSLLFLSSSLSSSCLLPLSSSFEVGCCAFSLVALFSTWSTWAWLFSAVSDCALSRCILSAASMLSIISAVCCAGLFSLNFCLSACCSVVLSWRSFSASAESSITATCCWVTWRVVDLLSSNDKCTTSGDFSSLTASFTCITTSVGSWLRRAWDWFLLALASFDTCWVFCCTPADVKVSPRSSLPRDPRWLFDLRLVRVCSTATLSEVSERLLSVALAASALLSLRLLSWRLLRLRSLWRLLSCWRLSWLSVLSSVLVTLPSAVSLTVLLSVSSDGSFLARGLDGLALRGLRLLLSSASLLSSLLLSVTDACWRFCGLAFFWSVDCCGTVAFWLLLVFPRAVLSTCPNEPKLCAPVFTNASIASAASRLLILDIVWACGACANKLDNQATACGCAAAIAVAWGATGAVGLATFWVSLTCCACGARADVTLLLLLLVRCSLLWLVLFCGGVGILCWALGCACAWLPLLLSALWRGWRVGCCSGRSFSAVCQSTL